MKHMKKLINRNNIYFLISFLFCFAVIAISEFLFIDQQWNGAPITTWLGDAGGYWTYGEQLKNASFDFTVLDGFRGYVFPLYLGIINLLGGKTLWYIVNGIFYAIFAVVVIPGLTWRNEKTTREKTVAICICWLLLNVLFVGLVAYPLSDLFALALMCIAVLFMKKHISSSQKVIKVITAFLTGCFCYMAYNVRTIYLFSCIVLLVIYIYNQIFSQADSAKSQNILNRILLVGMYIFIGVCGVFVAAIPQIIMNQEVLGEFSLSVPTNNLMLSQVGWGFRYQRYDTYIPRLPDPAHPFPQVYFTDAAGIKLLNEAGISEFESWGEFITLFLRHPIDIVLMYFRHFVNYLLPCFPQVYITDLNSSKWGWGILCVTIFFIAGFVILNKCVRIPKNTVCFIPIIIPGLLILPGAVEHRFSLPIYFFVICLLCFNTDWAKVKRELIACKWSAVFMYLMIGLMCFTIWSEMLASEAVTPLLF